MAPTADLFSRIPSDDSESDTPEKCRKRRHRRIEMRRMRISSSRISPLPFRRPPNQRAIQETLSNQRRHSQIENPMPNFGWLSVQGLSKSMDDAVFVKEEFCRPHILGGRPLHFFSVYDGHGGSHVSTLCKEMMHRIMVEELTSLHNSKTTAIGFALAYGDPNKQQKEQELEDLLRVGIERSFARMGHVALCTCVCGKAGSVCGCQRMEMAFSGSTAVVALLSPDHIVVANCGDSRAVLCRNGKPIPLSLDHKPERPDELERIRAAGGKLNNQNGVRVNGSLSMSRSLGDNLLKRVITSHPEISITERGEQDECLILASDGLWDVLSNDLACQLAIECLREGSPATAPTLRSQKFSGRRRPIEDVESQVLFPSKSNFAAAILCRLALARGSLDNISVIVIDLINNPK